MTLGSLVSIPERKGSIMAINLDDMYAVLVPVARSKGQITYGDLSQRYFERTQEFHEPHGSWDEPLGKLNQVLHAVQWPPLSGVVVLQDTKEPGGGFWESSPNVPRRPANEIARIGLYGQILRPVHDANWPDTIPVAPPT